jgi:hypothetical protein
MGLSQTPAPAETQAQSVPVDHRPQGAKGIAQPVSRFGVGDGADAERAQAAISTARCAEHPTQSRSGSTRPPHARRRAGGAGSGIAQVQSGTTEGPAPVHASVSLPKRHVSCRSSPFTAAPPKP